MSLPFFLKNTYLLDRCFFNLKNNNMKSKSKQNNEIVKLKFIMDNMTKRSNWNNKRRFSF